MCTGESFRDRHRRRVARRMLAFALGVCAVVAAVSLTLSAAWLALRLFVGD